MAKSCWSHALVWVSLAGALAGCSTVPDSQRPASPPPNTLDAAATGGEPVPQTEPPSRSGNADTYVVFGRRYRVKETSAGYRERGTASWYGWEFHGRKTSSGPPFNMFDLTAAHKSLPLPTYVRVTNLDNGRSTVVKVTDRGPFVGTRLIDLSYAAAVRLGMEEQGTAPVEVVALEPYQFLPKLAAYRAEQRELLASRAARAKPKTESTGIEFARVAPIRPSARAPDRPPARLLASMGQSKPLARLANGERNPSPVKAPVRLALADVKRGAPKTVAKVTSAKPARAENDRNAGRGGSRPPSTVPVSKGKEAMAKPPVPATNANRHGKPVPARQAGVSRPTVVRLASLKISRSRGVAD